MTHVDTVETGPAPAGERQPAPGPAGGPDGGTPAAEAPERLRDVVRTTVERLVAALDDRPPGTSSQARADLARLRRAVHVEPGADPTVWALTVGSLPEQLLGRGDLPSPSERAVHVALTVFAGHQQSQSASMHRRGTGLGTAMRRLVPDGSEAARAEAERRVLRRFHALGTATDFPEAAHHLRGLVGQLRSTGVPLDYGLLAEDLRDLQHPDRVAAVRLRWGRDYHRPRPSGADGTAPASGTDAHPEVTA